MEGKLPLVHHWGAIDITWSAILACNCTGRSVAFFCPCGLWSTSKSCCERFPIKKAQVALVLPFGGALLFLQGFVNYPSALWGKGVK